MTKELEIYKCNICGNIVEVVHTGATSLVCCGQPMELQTEKSTDEGNEKHKPVIEGNVVKVGSVPHPMTEEHHIEWIESINDEMVCRKKLDETNDPSAEFPSDVEKARSYCNLHGLWQS